jgi:hypothetical protein
MYKKNIKNSANKTIKKWTIYLQIRKLFSNVWNKIHQIVTASSFVIKWNIAAIYKNSRRQL